MDSRQAVTRAGPADKQPTLRHAPHVDADDLYLLVELRGHLFRRQAVTITGGITPSRDSDGYRVPKRDLVSTLQVLLQTQRLKVAQGLPDAAVLVQELLNFQVKITDAANDTYGAWREGTHDDLVLAVALAVWDAERYHNNVLEPLDPELAALLEHYRGI